MSSYGAELWLEQPGVDAAMEYIIQIRMNPVALKLIMVLTCMQLKLDNNNALSYYQFLDKYISDCCSLNKESTC